MSRRLMMAKSGGNAIPADTPFVRVDAANALLCSIDGRAYRKAYDGEAWAALIFTADGYTCPALLARTVEAAICDPLISDPPKHAIIAGTDWYWRGTEWAQPERWGDDMWDRVYENPLALPYIAPPGDTAFDTGDPEAAAETLVRILLGLDLSEVARPEG